MTDGVLLVDKPAGVTSHGVVARARRRLGRGVKVGHAGTLDPFATGLLLVLVGRATRVQRFLMALPKRYETVARLGFVSSTGDVEGEIVPGERPPDPLPLVTRPVADDTVVLDASPVTAAPVLAASPVLAGPWSGWGAAADAVGRGL